MHLQNALARRRAPALGYLYPPARTNCMAMPTSCGRRVPGLPRSPASFSTCTARALLPSSVGIYISYGRHRRDGFVVTFRLKLDWIWNLRFELAAQHPDRTGCAPRVERATSSGRISRTSAC